MKDENLRDNQVIILSDESLGRYRECCVRGHDKVGYQSIKISSKASEDLRIEPGSLANIYTIKDEHSVPIKRIHTQDIGKIADMKISLSKEDYKKITKNHYWYRVVNHSPERHSSIFIRFAEVEPSATLKPGHIKLNRYQRELLQEKPNTEVSLDIAPCLYTLVKNGKPRRRLSEVLTDRLVGNAELLLKAARPYPVDETKDIIRLTSTNLDQLGVEEGDRLFVCCGPEKQSLRAFKMDSPELFEAANLKSSDYDPEYSVGIPAHIRRKCRIDDLSYCIWVKRDTAFLFRKHFSSHFLTLAVTLLTVVSTVGTITQDAKILIISLIIYLLMVPSLVYLLFSGIRKKVR